MLQNVLNTFIKRESSVTETQSDKKYNQKTQFPGRSPKRGMSQSCTSTYPLSIYSLKRQQGLVVSSAVFSVHSPFRALPASASYTKTDHFSSCSSRSLAYSIELITLPSNSSCFETGPGLAVATSPSPNIFAKKLAVAFPALSRGSRFRVSVHLYGTK